MDTSLTNPGMLLFSFPIPLGQVPGIEGSESIILVVRQYMIEHEHLSRNIVVSVDLTVGPPQQVPPGNRHKAKSEEKNNRSVLLSNVL